VSLKSAFHTLLDEVHLPNEGVRDRIRDEVDVKDVPDTPETVTVSDQKAAGVAPEDTVTVADQKAGQPAPAPEGE
jgi:hypothetical protein